MISGNGFIAVKLLLSGQGKGWGGKGGAVQTRPCRCLKTPSNPFRSKRGESSTPINKGMNFNLTGKNRKELAAYAKAQGTTASRVLRMLLIEAGIISNDPIKVRRDLNGYRGKAQTFQRAIQAALKKAPKP